MTFLSLFLSRNANFVVILLSSLHWPTPFLEPYILMNWHITDWFFLPPSSSSNMAMPMVSGRQRRKRKFHEANSSENTKVLDVLVQKLLLVDIFWIENKWKFGQLLRSVVSGSHFHKQARLCFKYCSMLSTGISRSGSWNNKLRTSLKILSSRSFCCCDGDQEQQEAN